MEVGECPKTITMLAAAESEVEGGGGLGMRVGEGTQETIPPEAEPDYLGMFSLFVHIWHFNSYIYSSKKFANIYAVTGKRYH